jgi:two-component system response regulator HydG
MSTRILIVEDQFIEANNLKIILKKAGYIVCTIARSVREALIVVEEEEPELVLLDIHLQGDLTGIDLAKTLSAKNIAFVFLSANSNRQILNAAKATNPYGFLVKPFRKKDVLVMLDVAWYRHSQFHRAEPTAPTTTSYTTGEFPSIIGTGKAIKEVLENVRIVGASAISVLLLGESGTGKELVAQCIQRISSRKTKPFIVVNCAALPGNLIESELFGHEKGSFTGAIEKRIGKFEQGNGGTVFLDEIGELPLDLQVKLLRVLQEQEIEPIGGKKKKIDVRIIAATNRNLEEEMAAGRFRIDLYYRLNVFPINLPPLRERKEDIAALAVFFLKKYSFIEGKDISGVADNVLRAMLNYSWPGNIRQLENLMSRSVLLTTGHTVIDLNLPTQMNEISVSLSGKTKSLSQNEREHILATLEKCNWKIHGPGGAAESLELNSSTLVSRMKKLGIEKKITAKNE